MSRALALLLMQAVFGALVAATPTQQGASRPKSKPADNSYCLVCHANLRAEALAKAHQAAGVGCARCHGESDKHSSDENNVTPPDIMFPADKIAAACMKCHPASGWKRQPAKATHRAYIAARPSASACTRCHGSHRLPVRTRRWDKTTGKLIRDDGVRMLPEAKPGR